MIFDTPVQRFTATDEERMVRQSAADFVRGRLAVDAVRKLGAFAPAGFDPAVWAEMVALGWPGMAVAEEYGGAGLGVRALLGVIEEMGKVLAASPLASSALVAALVIARFGAPEVAQAWLPGIAQGEVLAALAVEEGPHGGGLETVVHVDGGMRVSGAKRYVADGMAAGLLLVSALCEGAPVLALVRGDAAGVTRRAVATIDGRGLAEIGFENVPVAGVLRGLAGRDVVEYARDCARVGLAAEMLGAISRAFEMTLDYMRTRRQFGQLIGSFQALQHRAAKLFIEIELARSCVEAAGDALHRDSSDLPVLACLAKASAGELMRVMAYEMIQLHGGIGMTEAFSAGLYLKRGRVAALLHGDAAFHVDRYARLKGF